MKRNLFLRVPCRLPTCAVVCVIAAATLHAQNPKEPSCSNALLKGRYSFGGDGVEAVLFGGFPGALIGTFQADGEGRITAFQLTETVHTPPDAMGFLVIKRDPIAEGLAHIDYTVAADCTGVISWIDQSALGGEEPAELPFVLADGGRQGWALRTKSPSTLLLTFKRVGAFDRQLETKIDAILRRLGVPPSQLP